MTPQLKSMTTDQLRELAAKKAGEYLAPYEIHFCTPSAICKHDVKCAHQAGAALFLEPLAVAMVGLNKINNASCAMTDDEMFEIASEALAKIAALLEK